MTDLIFRLGQCFEFRHGLRVRHGVTCGQHGAVRGHFFFVLRKNTGGDHALLVHVLRADLDAHDLQGHDGSGSLLGPVSALGETVEDGEDVTVPLGGVAGTRHGLACDGPVEPHDLVPIVMGPPVGLRIVVAFLIDVLLVRLEVLHEVVEVPGVLDQVRPAHGALLNLPDRVPLARPIPV